MKKIEKQRVKVIFLSEDNHQLFTLENLYTNEPKEVMKTAKLLANKMGINEKKVIVQDDPSDVGERLERIEAMLTKIIEAIATMQLCGEEPK